MDLLATADSDIDITNGALSWVTGLDAIRQNVEMGLRIWLAESVYDRNQGVPYIQVIFQRGASLAAIRFIVERQILSHDGVTEVLELAPVIDVATRTMRVTGRVRAIEGEFPLSLEIAA